MPTVAASENPLWVENGGLKLIGRCGSETAVWTKKALIGGGS